LDILVKAIAKNEPVAATVIVNTAIVEKARVLHDTYPTATAALGRTMTAVMLMASLLKEGQKISMQIVGDGPLKEVFAEADWLSRVRGYVRKPHVFMGLIGESLDVGRAIGAGYLHVIKDLGLKESYHSSVPLQTGEIASDIAYYLSVSEQFPTAVSLGVYVDTDNSVKASGGFLVHTLPGADDWLVTYLEDRISTSPTVSSMVLDGKKPEELIGEILGLPFDVIDQREISYYCPCSKDRVLRALITFGEQELRQMISGDETLAIQCHFCKTDYSVNPLELEELIREMRAE
jgi:molecular chaperone Hsp33